MSKWNFSKIDIFPLWILKILCILNIRFPNSKSMRKTLKINQTSYYSIQNELPKWRNFLVMCVQNRTPYYSLCKAAKLFPEKQEPKLKKKWPRITTILILTRHTCLIYNLKGLRYGIYVNGNIYICLQLFVKNIRLE